MKLDICGDSLSSPVSSGGVNAGQKWPNLIASSLGIPTVVNRAADGDQAGDQSNKAVPVNRSLSDYCFVMVGTNDARTYQGNLTKQEYFVAFLRRLIVDAITPSRVLARSAAMQKTGSWSNTAVNSIGIVSTQTGASARATVSGEAVYVKYIIQNHSSAKGIADVFIDGVLAGSVSCDGTGGMNTYNGATYAAACQRFGGLSSGPHEVEVIIKSSSLNFYLDEISGNDQPSTKPLVAVANVIRMTPAGYAANGGSDANVAAFNSKIADVVAEFVDDGFSVILVDNHSLINPATDLGSDGVHLSAAGQVKVKDNFVTAVNSTPKTVTYPTSWGGLLTITILNGKVTQVTGADPT